MKNKQVILLTSMHFVIPNPVYILLVLQMLCKYLASVKCFSLSAHTSPYLYSSQHPLEVLADVSMRVPVTANRVTCVIHWAEKTMSGVGVGHFLRALCWWSECSQ